jgi:pSer/pThr/pTyr-binding forkhead associated (FHA) protein
MERPEQRVALIEWLDREGHVQRSVDVAAWPLSLGRALDNTVVLDDPFVAAHHARLLPGEDGRLLLQALPSHNGLRLDGRALDGPTPVPAGGGLLQLGQTRLRLRVADADAALAPEKPLPATPALTRRGPLLAAGALMALVLGGQWLSLDPGADYTAWLPLALGLPAVVMVWCGIWALLSKLFQHRFDFSGHLRIALPWLLAMQVQDMLWPQLTAALALPGLWMAGSLLENLLLIGLLHAHLRHTLPPYRRAVTAVVAVAALVGLGLTAAITWRGHDSLVATPYMSTLPLPALQLRGTVPSATLVQEMAPLAERLAERVERARQDEAEGRGEGEDEEGE